MSSAAASGVRTDLDHEPDELIEAARERVTSRLRGRDFALTIALATTFAAGAAAELAFLPSDRPFHLLTAALFALAYVVAMRVQFEVGLGFAVPTQLVFVPMLFLLPARSVPIVVAAAYLVSSVPDHLRGKMHVERLPVHLLSCFFALGPALVLALAHEPAPDWRRHAPLFLGALAAQFAFDGTSAAIRGRLAFGLRARELGRAFLWPWAVDASLAPLGLVIAFTSQERPYAVVLAMPLLALLAFFARERRARVDSALELSSAYRGTALLLGDVIEADHEYTGSHSRDVVDLVLGVADGLGLDGSQRRKAEFAALLHDVGKIRIPQEILDKPAALDARERAIIETHTLEGEKMLEKVGGLLGDVGRIVRSCHERWDGAGYPDRLAARDIPLIARIVCCCDAFSAMTSDRPYRRAMSVQAAREELRRCRGTHFDPTVVDALLAVAPR